MDARGNQKYARRDSKSRSMAAAAVRQPFADLSNFNLTPIETLCKLCCPTATVTTTTTSGASSAGTSYSNIDSAVLKPPSSVSQSDSKSSKPYLENSTDAKSDTSVGSSSFVRLQETRKFGFPPLSRSSLNTSASADGKLGVNGQRKTPTKSNWEKQATVLPCSTLRESKKGKGQAISDLDICFPYGSNKENEELIGTGNRDKGKEIVENDDFLTAKNKQDRGKEAIEGVSSPPPKNNKNRVTASLAINSPLENTNKEKDNLHHVSLLSTAPKKNRGMESFGSLSSPPSKVKRGGKATVDDGCILDEVMAEKVSGLPLKRSPPRKIRGRKKPHRFVFSCPPLTRTKNTSVSEAGDAESFGSMTDPNKKFAKKRRSEEQPFTEFVLPKDFVEKQRAYFKEIDDFELEVEEASE
ncbi:unnamed protein product [Cuscuta campestris]|uniref:Sororin C-terminal region domain-containing protein n=1 Tax=Cuscuta campestris TaxID=132261 RepID=A0A484LM25_9ASTE|nr:unnamed protein product [Cuscuta campestris]